MNDTPHVVDRVQDLLDARLSPAESALVRDHLGTCDACRSEFDTLQRVRRSTARLRVDVAPPPDLLVAIGRGLDAERGVSRSGALPGQWSRRRVLLAGSGLAASLLVATGLWRLMRRQDRPSLVAADYRALAEGRLRLERTSSDPSELETYFDTAGVTSRVIDLAAMDYRLEGGLVHAAGGTRTAMYTYRGSEGERVVCQMYDGSLTDLPQADVVRAANGFTFMAFHRSGVNMVFWEEGNTVCVLAGELLMDPLLRLATQKAMAPA